MPRSASASQGGASLVPAALVVYGLLGAIALGWNRCAGIPQGFGSVEAARQGVSWVRDLGLGFGVGVALVLASRVFTEATAAGRALADGLAALLGRPGLAACALLALLSGVAEEAFFRGALQPRVGLVAASLLFGLAHFVPRRELLAWPVFGFAAGLVFGALFAATGNLVAPALAHCTVNALNLRWIARRGWSSGP